jgi:sterol 3beta-glucosyltransferase
MKITLIGYGTRGDVQPNVCLGWVLQQRGHEITVAAPLNMASFVRAAGLQYSPLPLDVQALFAADEAQKMLASGKIQAFFAWLGEVEREHAAAMRAALHEACAPAEAMVVHPLMEDRAAAFGAARRAPVVPLYFFPVPPSRRFASPFITTRNLGFLNRLTHKLLLDMLWKSSRDDVATLRRELGVAPAATSFVREAQRRGLLTLLAYSEALFPRPDDWGPHDVMCGSIVMPEALKQQVGEHALPADLVAWLDQGPAPVFLGFGSMPVLDVEAMLATARTALAAVGARGIVGAGWSRFVGADDPTLRVVGAVDHSALFARCRAAVHHGGSGTTYASLRAGLPTLVCSVFADQPFWGVRCRRLGVGDTIPFAGLDAGRLTAGLRKVLDPEVQSRARALGDTLSRERALDTAVELLERHLPTAPPPS